MQKFVRKQEIELWPDQNNNGFQLINQFYLSNNPTLNTVRHTISFRYC